MGENIFRELNSASSQRDFHDRIEFRSQAADVQ